MSGSLYYSKNPRGSDTVTPIRLFHNLESIPGVRQCLVSMDGHYFGVVVRNYGVTCDCLGLVGIE